MRTGQRYTYVADPFWQQRIPPRTLKCHHQVSDIFELRLGSCQLLLQHEQFLGLGRILITHCLMLLAQIFVVVFSRSSSGMGTCKLFMELADLNVDVVVSRCMMRKMVPSCLQFLVSQSPICFHDSHLASQLLDLPLGGNSPFLRGLRGLNGLVLSRMCWRQVQLPECLTNIFNLSLLAGKASVTC